MKNLISRRLLPALAVVCASAMFFACQKDPIETINPTPEVIVYKDLTIMDASGQNSVVLRVSSSETALFEAQDWSKVFTLEAKTETPDVQDFNKTPEQEEAPEGYPEVNFEILSQQLQPGVKALALHFSAQTNGGADDRWQWVTTYTTSYDRIQVQASYGCHSVYYYKRPSSGSSYKFMASYYVCPSSYSWAYSIPSYRMRAKVYYNNNTSFSVWMW